MKILNKLDLSLEKFFQKTTDSVYNTFGINNIQISSFFFWIAIIMHIVYLAIETSIKYSIFLPIICLLYFFYYKTINKTISERRAKSNEEETVLPLSIIQILTWRKIWLIIIPLETILTLFIFNSGAENEKLIKLSEIGIGFTKYFVISTHGYQIGNIICLYFLSCTKPPKKKSKVREFLESLLPQKQLATV